MKDNKVENLLKLLNLRVDKTNLFRDDKVVGSLKYQKLDIKDVYATRIDKGNLKYSLISNDKSDIKELLYLKLETDIVSFETYNTLDKRLEFNGHTNRYTIHLELDTDEVKLKIMYPGNFLEFHLVNRITNDKKIECCNIRFGSEILYYKNTRSLFGNMYEEQLYRNNIVNEYSKAFKLNLKPYLYERSYQILFSLLKNEINIILGPDFFDNMIKVALGDEIDNDFNYLKDTVQLKYTR